MKIPATVEITSWDGKAYVKPSIQTSTEVAPQLVGAGNAKRPAGTPDDKPENVEIGEGDIIRVDSQLVTLNISVIDRSTSRGLAGLVQSDFRLFEDGQEQRVVQFESSSAPFDLVLLIDLSGSTKEVVKLIRAAALRFVNAARPADHIAIITLRDRRRSCRVSLPTAICCDKELRQSTQRGATPNSTTR